MRKFLKYLLLICGILFTYNAITSSTSYIVYAILAVLCFVAFKKLGQPKGENKSTTKPQIKKGTKKQQVIKDEHGKIEFEVAGTFVEERQKTIKKFIKDEIKNGTIDAYGGLTTKEIKSPSNKNIEIYEIPEGQSWKGSFKNNGYVILEREIDNEHDKNAIKIVLEEYNQIGYVPKNKNIEIGKLLDENKIISFEMVITGGKYKLWDGETLENDEEDYAVNIIIYY